MDNQEAVEIKVYQGESRTASENTLLGKFLLEDIPKAPAGEPQIVVSFDHDVDGIVHVTARDKNTGNERGITVSASLDRLTEAEREEARIKSEEMWETPSNKGEIRALIKRAKRIAKEVKDKRVSKELVDLVSRLQDDIKRDQTGEMKSLEEKLLDLMYELLDPTLSRRGK